MGRYGDMKNNEGYADPTAGAVLRKESAAKVQRGEIYYIDIPYATGHEMEKSRPGIIVSCKALNDTSPCVTVVFCTGSPKGDLPEHITIRSTPKPSIALCEQIYTVDKSRLSNRLGRVTDQEMTQIDVGIMAGLSADYTTLQGQQNRKETLEEQIDTRAAQKIQEYANRAKAAEENLEQFMAQAGNDASHVVRIEAELDTYKRLYEGLLDRMSIERRATA